MKEIGDGTYKYASKHPGFPHQPIRQQINKKPPSAPGKPILVPFELTNSEPDVVTIRWSRPVFDGGAPIIGFIVEHRRTGSPHWIRACPQIVPNTELSLSGLEPGWRYQFRIIAENAVGKSDPSEISDPLTVTLQRNAISAPRFTVELADIMSIENDKVEFRVNVLGSPQPQVSWFKDGFEIFSSRRTKIVTENDYSVLVIHQASLTDEGEIKCTATNRAGYAVTKAKLTIEAPPKIRLPRQYEDGLIIEADEIIRLKVGIAGRPMPTVDWNHNGETITSGGRYEILNTDKNSSLKIVNAKREDRGEYHIRAMNKLGEDNTAFLVTITARPTPPGKVIIKMSLAKSVTLSWTPPDDDGGCKIGNYIVEYFRVGWGVWLKASTCRQLTTTLNDLIEGSQYKFRVKAENPYGLSDPSEESDVIFIPDPKRGITKPSDETPDIKKPILIPRTKKESKSQERESTGKSIKFKTDILDNSVLEREMSYGASDEFYKFKEVPSNALIEPSTLEKQVQQLKHAKHNVAFLPDNNFGNRNVNLNMYDNNSNFLTQNKENNKRDDNKLNGNVVNDINNNQLSTLANTKTPSSKSSDSDAQNIHNSSEFVLVLYPDKESNDEKKNEKFDHEMEDMVAPPPLSQSAPELSMEPPSGPILRFAVSSTELLYERAMARFYQAVEYEEEMKSRKRSFSVEQEAVRRKSFTMDQDVRKLSLNADPFESAVTRLKISSLTDSERRSSLRRKLSGEVPNLALNIPKLVVRGDCNENDELDGTKDKVESVLTEEETAGIQEQSDQREIINVEENDSLDENEEYFSDDYTESTASEEASVDDKAELMKRLSRIEKGDESETYHPRNMEPRMLSPYRHPENHNAVEVLTKPLPHGDPNFVPKPILKKPSVKPEMTERIDAESTAVPVVEPDVVDNVPSVPTDFEEAGPSNKIPVEIEQPFVEIQAEPARFETSENKIKIEIQQPEPEPEPEIEPEPIKVDPKSLDPKKRKLLENRQNSIEENKVVAEFYGDIIREIGGKIKKPKVPLYMNPEALKQLEQSDDEHADELSNERFKGVIEQKPVTMIKRASLPVAVKEVPQPVEKKMSLVKSRTLPDDDAEQPVDVAEIKKPLPPIQIPAPIQETNKNQFRPVRSRDSSATRSNASISSSQLGGTRQTPVRFMKSTSQTRNRSASKSPVPLQRKVLDGQRVPRLVRVNITPSSSQVSSRASSPVQLQEEITTKVKSSLSYLTDLSLFLFATYIYLFKHPLLALPILMLLIHRQLGDFIKSKFPDFTKDRKS